MSQKPDRRILSEERIELERKHRTHFALSYAQRATKNVEDLKQDARRDKRREAGECKTCFYLKSARVGGAELTKAACRMCGREMILATAATPPEICSDCAKENELCRMCMADQELRLQ